MIVNIPNGGSKAPDSILICALTAIIQSSSLLSGRNNFIASVDYQYDFNDSYGNSVSCPYAIIAVDLW